MAPPKAVDVRARLKQMWHQPRLLISRKVIEPAMRRHDCACGHSGLCGDLPSSFGPGLLGRSSIWWWGAGTVAILWIRITGDRPTAISSPRSLATATIVRRRPSIVTPFDSCKRATRQVRQPNHSFGHNRARRGRWSPRRGVHLAREARSALAAYQFGRGHGAGLRDWWRDKRNAEIEAARRNCSS